MRSVVEMGVGRDKARGLFWIFTPRGDAAITFWNVVGQMGLPRSENSVVVRGDKARILASAVRAQGFEITDVGDAP